MCLQLYIATEAQSRITTYNNSDAQDCKQTQRCSHSLTHSQMTISY